MDAPVCAADRRSMPIMSGLTRILPFISVLRWTVPWLVLMQMAAGFSHYRGFHSMPRAMISQTRSNMLVKPQAQHIEAHYDNLRNCANFLFPQPPSTVQQFMDIVSGNKDFSRMLLCRPQPCPLWKHDAMLMLQFLTNALPSDTVSAQDLEDMSNVIERMLMPNNSLIDHDGRLTKTIYRPTLYNVIGNHHHLKPHPMSLRPWYEDVVPGARFDVHFVGGQDTENQILYAQTKGENMRFSGLSASTYKWTLPASLPLFATFHVDPNTDHLNIQHSEIVV